MAKTLLEEARSTTPHGQYYNYFNHFKLSPNFLYRFTHKNTIFAPVAHNGNRHKKKAFSFIPPMNLDNSKRIGIMLTLALAVLWAMPTL